ncbi:S8 family serine peptidase [Humibacillus xanthopallidus]|uniref:Subtilase family protein n=1 Tax=Humibacillus xanthopallidus TaxID=412689 RepID=A0A543HHM6_9MICO|nr:S8 family serine peptidase [Humibacillus xanthopallidus]TQM57831.1 subtilase family protein [Humibacillus xanthopallidus]
MRKIQGFSMRTAVALSAFGVIAAGGLTAPQALAAPSAAASPAKASQLGKHDRELLATARANGSPTVTLLIAAVPGQNSSVTSALKSLGAVISKADSDISYIRAVVPIDKAQTAANLSGIVAADLDEVIPLDDPTPQGSQPATPQTPPGPDTPRDNPYMPIRDTGAAAFTAAHPTWDGRGTTIGIVDSGIDLDHPALATTTTGERKITDWVTATDPITDDDPTWLNMSTQVTGPNFTFNGGSYVAPAGSYRIALFNEGDPRLGGEVGSDVNRDGDSTDKFAVLWDPAAGTVRVDTNQDNNLSNDQVLTDYAKKFDVGHFGTDNPATAVRESMPFVVQTDGKNKVVNIGIVSGEHGTHVAGITAANQMFGGAMSGAAPGAKLKSVRVCMFITGCTSHALIEGMTFIAKQGNVDVINMSIGGLPALNDGNNTRAVLYNRLIDQYNVQMFISAGNNGSGLNTIGDPAAASKVLAVGSYISKETWQKNYGSDSTYVDNLHGFSSRGPREDGGFKPEIVAPGAAISTTPMWETSSPVPGTYTLPAGYSMLQGTSMASPQAAGAGALLVSAAKQAGVQSKPAQLREALTSSARQLDRYGAYEQGNGLINVGAAWELLKTNLKPVDISSSVEVHTILSGFLATPGRGEGIFDREGVAAGDSYTRTYTFTRTTGGGGSRTYNLAWTGNDGTFESPASVALPLNTPTTVAVSVHPTKAGTHSAILNLDDPSTPGIEKQTLNTVVAAEAFTAANDYTVAHSGTIGRNQVTSYFFKVPANTPAFKVDLVGGGTTPGAGQIRFLRFHPYGVAIDDNSSLSCYTPTSGGCSTGSPTSRTTSNPQAGVWEVTVEARRTSDAENAPYTLTASILGASVTPNPDTIASATIGTPVARSYTLTNGFGAFTGRAVGTTLGSAKVLTPTIANGAQQQRGFVVTAGSTSLRATIGSTSDTGADLDLYVYNCTSGSCVLAGQSADGDSEESVTITNPAAGTWVTLVDGYAVPSGSTTFNYVDVFTNAAFGAAAVTDANALRPAGSSWTVPGTVTANAAPAAGRVLLGNVQVRTDTNILVGSGDVVIETITP